MGEYNQIYNNEEVSVIYNTDLQVHLSEIRNLQTHLCEVSDIFRQGSKGLTVEDKNSKIEEMKEYLEQGLASLAYSTTVATQKVDKGLRLQSEDLSRLSRSVTEISLQTEIKKEMKSRLAIGQLTSVKKRHAWRNITVVDDPHSKWKSAPPKYRRQALDLTILDHVGCAGLSSSSSTSTDRSSIGSRAGVRMSRLGSIDSHTHLRNNRQSQTTSAGGGGRANIGTLKKVGPLIKPKPRKSEEPKVLVEVEEKEEEGETGDYENVDSPLVERRNTKAGSLTIEVDGHGDEEENDEFVTPPSSGGGSLPVPAPPSYRLSNLPEVPDDFMTDIFSSLNRQASIIEEELDGLVSEKGTPTDVLNDPLGDVDGLPPVPDFMDIEGLPPPPPPPPST